MHEKSETYKSLEIEPLDKTIYIRSYYDAPGNAFSIHIDGEMIWHSWPDPITIDGEGWAEAAFL